MDKNRKLYLWYCEMLKTPAGARYYHTNTNSNESLTYCYNNLTTHVIIFTMKWRETLPRYKMTMVFISGVLNDDKNVNWTMGIRYIETGSSVGGPWRFRGFYELMKPWNNLILIHLPVGLQFHNIILFTWTPLKNLWFLILLDGHDGG